MTSIMCNVEFCRSRAQYKQLGHMYRDLPLALYFCFKHVPKSICPEGTVHYIGTVVELGPEQEDSE